jgi:hypothetical protein
MKSIQFRRNLTIILSTLFFVALIYILYIQVYARAREEKLIQTRFRVLDQMGENLKAKMESYKLNAGTYWREVKDTVNKLEKGNGNRADIKSTIKNSLSNKSNVYNKDIQYVDYLIFKETQCVDDRLDTVIKSNQDTIIKIRVRNDSIFLANSYLTFWLPPEFTLKNIDRKDVFGKVFTLIYDSSNSYCSLGDDLVFTNVTEHEAEKKQKGLGFTSQTTQDTITLPVSGELKSFVAMSDKYYEVVLSDGLYKLFIRPVKIDQSNWFIAGLVKNSDFQREKMAVAPWFVVVISLALLLIILSLPFIKLRVMPKTEELGKGTMFQVAVSLLLGVSFLIFCLFFQAHYFYKVSDSDEKLRNLSQSMVKSLNRELHLIYMEILNSDKDLLTDSNLTKIYNDKGIPTSYPYFDYIFRLDTNGKQVSLVSPFKEEQTFEPLSFRDYFKYFDEWDWKLANPDPVGYKIPENSKFRLESIVSTSSGEYKAAFATGSRHFVKDVVALTGRFYSLIDPILPKDYGFCVIDSQGKCWFHSNKYLNGAENFLDETNNHKGLRAALYSDVPVSMTVDYYNSPTRIYVRGIEGLPLYLVTFHDMRYEYSYQAQTFITTSMLIASLFTYMFLQLLLLLVLKKSGSILNNFLSKKYKIRNRKDEGILVDFTTLVKTKKVEYLYIISIMSFSILPLYFLIFQMPPAAAIGAIFIATTALQTILFHYLHCDKGNNSVLRIYEFINSILFYTGQVVMLYMLLIYDLTLTEKLVIMIFLILLLLVFNLVLFNKAKEYLRSLIRRSYPGILNAFDSFDSKFQKSCIAPGVAYSRMILTLILVFGIFPSLKFFDISADLENEVHIRHNQLELSRSREIRNKEFLAYFEKVDVTSKRADSIFSQRLDSGEFTSFWNSTSFQSKQVLKDSSDSQPAMFDTLMNIFRPVYGDPHSIWGKYLFVDSVSGRNYNWKVSGDSIELGYSSSTETLNRNRTIRSVISFQPDIWILLPFQKFVDFWLFKIFVFYIIILFILYLVYKLILVTTERLFKISLLDVKPLNDIALDVGEKIEAGISVILVNPTGIVGYDKFAAKVHSTIENLQKSLPDRIIVVVDNKLFANFEDPIKMEEDISVLLKNLRDSGIVVAISDKNPENVLAYYRDKSESKVTGAKSDLKPDALTEAYQKTYEKLKLLVPYLHKIEVPLDFPEIEKKKSVREDYFTGILDTCTLDEIFVLIDLSGDTLANYKNEETVKTLMKRGLISPVSTDKVIMNESFRSFLIHKYNKVARQKLKKLLQEGPSSWASFRLVILIVIVALFIFIFISNQEFLNNINKLFITLGASIAGITSLFNIVSKKNA